MTFGTAFSREIIRRMQQIQCVIHVPEPYRQRAWYGLRMLLLPFRLDPVLTDNADFEGDGVYYGTEDTDTSHLSDATWKLFIEPETWEYFERQTTDLPPHRHVRIGEDRIPVLFGAKGDLTFDPVAATFYFLSGWQEALQRRRDEHGRFRFEGSIQEKLDIRLTPVVEWYRHIAGDALAKKGVQVERKQFGDKTWAFCSTHDIDYVRKWRPGIYKREILDRALLNREKESHSDRLTRLVEAGWSLLHSSDPFRDAIERIQKELDTRSVSGTFFYKAGAHGHRDVEYDLHDSYVISALSEQLSAGHEVGLHPSYHAFSHDLRLSDEKNRLERSIHRVVPAHRAHYLRFDYPGSIATLQSAGFSIDSTLGFAECAGFRFGTCLPFPLLNPLTMDESTVWEVPLCVMESALFNRQNLTGVEAERETNRMIQTCASVGGVFVGLWHSTLWDERDYPGWGAHFLSSLDEARRFEAHCDSLSGVIDAWK